MREALHLRLGSGQKWLPDTSFHSILAVSTLEPQADLPLGSGNALVTCSLAANRGFYSHPSKFQDRFVVAIGQTG